MTRTPAAAGRSQGHTAPAIKPPSLRLTRRLQRSRKLRITPEGARYVGRGSRFANPFARRFSHAKAVQLHRQWLLGTLGPRRLLALGFCPAEIDALRRLRRRVLRSLPVLRGQDLQCWCPLRSRWCHADILLVLARSGTVR